ncbi:MAG TPA: hypothetical protein VIL20_26810 [Sandaracinaceae bacterium]
MRARGRARILDVLVRYSPAAIALVSCILGCAPSGEDPRSRLSVYEPETGEYRLHYLEPPWELVEAEGTRVFLRIRSNAMVFAGLDGGPAKYELLATVEPGTPESRASAEASAAVARGETVTGGPREIEAAGAVGRELLTQARVAVLDRNRRYVFLPLAGARVLRLAFDATPRLDTPEVDAMIDAVELGTEEP